MRLPKHKSTVPVPTVAMDRMHVLMEQYLASIEARNYSAESIRLYRFSIHILIAWCRERGIDALQEITRPVLERYQRSVYHFRKKNGEPLTIRSQLTRLRPLKGWFRWLARQNHILHNPASELEMPRVENRLPRHILNVEEAETVLAQPETATAEGLRDRAILETLYATGMRRMELANLKAHDIDYERGTVMIRQGKGKRDRHIPIGERALAWLAKYMREVRPGFLVLSDDGTVFLTALGSGFERWQMTQMVSRYVHKAKIGKTGSCHLFRHTVATLMLENGADIRMIQELLGHVSLETTQMYTRVSINMLKRVYTATHPGANLNRGAVAPVTLDTAADLLAALDAEAADEDA